MAAIASAVYRCLVPDDVAAAEMREPGDPALLHVDEALGLRSAAPKRIGDFAAGRLCARHALARFGIDAFPLHTAEDRRPVWPYAMVGSITHTEGFCAAVVAERRLLSGIGIDTEVVAPMSDRLCARISLPAEVEWLDTLPRAERAAGGMLLFSAKEAFYKAQYPIVGEKLGFHDIRVEIPEWNYDDRPSSAGRAAAFTVRPTRPLLISEQVSMPARGRYRFHEGFVSTAVAFGVGDPSCERLGRPQAQ